MEKTRLIYILTFIRNELRDDISQYHDAGICAVVNYLKTNNFITYREGYLVVDYLYDNKPTNKNEYAEFMDNEFWYDKLCWWKMIYHAPETRQIRIDYLNKLIENSK